MVFLCPLDYIVSGLGFRPAEVRFFITNGRGCGWISAPLLGDDLQSFQAVQHWDAGQPERLVRAHCVQEDSTGNPGSRALFYDQGLAGARKYVPVYGTDEPSPGRLGELRGSGGQR